jgi:hypothetical protein
MAPSPQQFVYGGAALLTIGWLVYAYELYDAKKNGMVKDTDFFYDPAKSGGSAADATDSSAADDKKDELSYLTIGGALSGVAGIGLMVYGFSQSKRA